MAIAMYNNQKYVTVTDEEIEEKYNLSVGNREC